MEIKNRVERHLQRHGESITINPGGIAAKAIFQLLESGRLTTYFDSIEQGSLSRPGLITLVGADVNVATGNTIVRDGRTYAVKKMHRVREADTVIVKFLALA